MTNGNEHHIKFTTVFGLVGMVVAFGTLGGMIAKNASSNATAISELQGSLNRIEAVLKKDIDHLHENIRDVKQTVVDIKQDIKETQAKNEFRIKILENKLPKQ